MSYPILLRFVWKEYRMLRGFWISLALLSMILQLWLAALPLTTENVVPLFTVALAAAALYALGVGATMFATEREEETFEFLRSLPLAGYQLLIGKLAFAATSTLAFGAALCAPAWFLADMRLPGWPEQVVLWSVLGLGAAEFFSWGMFFSLIVARPLNAALLAAATASVLVSALVVLDGNALHRPNEYVSQSFSRIAVIAVIMTINVGLALSWLTPTGLRVRRLTGIGRNLFPGESHDVRLRPPMLDRDGLARLVWHAWRQVRRMFAVFAVAIGTMFLLTVMSSSWESGVISLVVSTWFVGSTIFLEDQQRHSYRFFTEHGVSARSVWLSRQIVGVCAVAAMAVVAVTIPLFLKLFGSRIAFSEANEPVANWFREQPSVVAAMILLTTFMAYSSGQFCSLLLRSGIMAGFFGLVMTVLLSAWALLMTSIGFNPLWSVLPIPLSLMYATWLRAPQWLLETNTVPAWTRVGLCVGSPAVVVAGAAMLTRVYEIPLVDRAFDPVQYAGTSSTTDQETAALYREAAALLDDATYRDLDYDFHPTELARQWVESHADVLQMVYRVTERPMNGLVAPRDANYTDELPFHVRKVSHLLLLNARKHEEDGELSAALRDYEAMLRSANQLRKKGNVLSQVTADGIEESVLTGLLIWSGRPRQSAELLRSALDMLTRAAAERPSRADGIKTEDVILRRLCGGDFDEIAAFQLPENVLRRIMFVSYAMPWERTRAERILNLVALRQLKALEHVERRLKRNAPVVPSGLPDVEVIWPRLEFWISTTPLLEQFAPQYGLEINEFQMELFRRATNLILALQTWRSENGQLPSSLESLVSPVLGELPLDPATGGPFRYFPEGVSAEVYWRTTPPGAHGPRNLQAGTPFVWSPGFSVQQIYSSGDIQVMAQGPFRSVDESAMVELKLGWAFPIPGPE